MDRHTSASDAFGENYSSDANSNMTQRVELSGTQWVSYGQAWDIDNRLIAITSSLGYTSTFFYSADGERVKKLDSNSGWFYIGNILEKDMTRNVRTTYYYLGSQRVVMRVSLSGPYTGTLRVAWIYGDHLGSASLTTNITSTTVSEMRYFPFGEVRYQSGIMPTDRTFTGQRLDSYSNIYEMGAQRYSPLLGRFLSPDTIVQDPHDPQALGRYAYARNNPLKYIDRDGRFLIPPVMVVCVIGGVLLVGGGAVYVTNYTPGAAQRQAQAPHALTAFFDVVNGDIQSVWNAINGTNSAQSPSVSNSGNTSSPMGPNLPQPDPDKDPNDYNRYKRLGEDPDQGGRWRQTESDTGWRLEQKLGRTIERFDRQNPNKVGDWYDPSTGKTYDGIGNLDGQYFKFDDFTHQITDYLSRQGLDKVVIDFKGLSELQIKDVTEWILRNKLDQLDRIIPLYK